MQVTEIERHLDAMAQLSQSLGGCLSEREARFLSLAAATLPPSLGEVLEIGSFKGKSTTLLAKSVSLVGGTRIHAVDPLNADSATVPRVERGEILPDIFRATLEANEVQDIVEFYQIPSQELAATWDKPLRLLWIDGDHTYQGALADFENFAQFLQPGSVIAFHDVLHPSEGPLRTFCEKVLLSSSFGPCGICGSIGWAQYLGSSPNGKSYISRKLAMYSRLSRLIRFVVLNRTTEGSNPLGWRILRPLVPHGSVNAGEWQATIAKNLPVA